MTKTEFFSRILHATDTHSMEAMAHDAGWVAVTYETQEQFNAQAGRDTAALVDALSGTDARLSSFNAGSWDRPETPRYRLIVTFEGVR